MLFPPMFVTCCEEGAAADRYNSKRKFKVKKKDIFYFFFVNK